MAAARAQYRRVPDAQYLTEWGMPAEQFADAFQALVWPENWLAWCLFVSVATQWRSGPGGPIGLDYSALDREMQVQGIPADQHRQLRDDVRVLEAAALESIYEED